MLGTLRDIVKQGVPHFLGFAFIFIEYPHPDIMVQSVDVACSDGAFAVLVCDERL